MAQDKLTKLKSYDGLTRYVAMDCEMVGVGDDGNDDMIARVSIVNYFGHCIYDKYVTPMEPVTDYRTPISGIRPNDLRNAVDFKTAQQEVYDIIKGRILVGHSVKNDLKALFLSHSKSKIRDTSWYFRRKFGGRTPSLKKLTKLHLGVDIQEGEHDSVQDAKAAMRLYTFFKKEWEKDIKTHFGRINKGIKIEIGVFPKKNLKKKNKKMYKKFC